MHHPRGLHPEDRRTAPIVKVPNSAMGGGTHWCPHDGFRLIYERVNINNYICPQCGYELELQSRHEDNHIATISTIDGWTDPSMSSQGTKTSKFRPVEGARKDAMGEARYHPVLQPDIQRMAEERSLKILSSEEKIGTSRDILDFSEKRPYNSKVRKKTYPTY